MQAIEYIRKIKCVSPKDSVSELKLDMQQVIMLMDGYHREKLKNHGVIGDVRLSLPSEEKLEDMAEDYSVKCGLSNFLDDDEVIIAKNQWKHGYESAIKGNEA